MTLGLRSQPLSRQCPPRLARTLSGLAHRPARTYTSKSTNATSLLSPTANILGRPRRYKQLQVRAFKGESSLAARDASQEDSACCRSGAVRYRFIVPQYVTTFGQSLRVVGSLPELGDWNPQRAPVMTWSDGHQWSLECALPQRSFEFKITVFEGHGVKWEGGSNRVVQAEDEAGDIPVEIVVWLTCNFNATSSTQLQLAVPRASLQDAYETSKATLEFLNRRKSKLGQDSSQASSADERLRHKTEIARLSDAVAEQSTVVHQLSDWLGHEVTGSRTADRQNGKKSSVAASSAEEDDKVLLLAIDSVHIPRALRRISFVQSWNAGSGMLPAGHVGNGVPQALTSSPFLRGELDSRAEDLMDAAKELLESATEGSQASIEWASLAQEAGQVAVAMEALDAAGPSSGQPTQRHMRGLASVGSALAGGSTAVEPAADDVTGAQASVLAAIVMPSSPDCTELDVAETDSTRTVEQAELSDAASTGAVTEHGAADAALTNSGVMVVGAAEGVGIVSEEAAVSTSDVASNGAALVTMKPQSPEAHPLQRLAANIKDFIRVPGQSATSFAPLRAPTWPLRAPAQQGAEARDLNIASYNAASSPHGPEPQQRESVIPAGVKWASKFDVRAFLESLFM